MLIGGGMHNESAAFLLLGRMDFRQQPTKLSQFVARRLKILVFDTFFCGGVFVQQFVLFSHGFAFVRQDMTVFPESSQFTFLAKFHLGGDLNDELTEKKR